MSNKAGTIFIHQGFSSNLCFDILTLSQPYSIAIDRSIWRKNINKFGLGSKSLLVSLECCSGVFWQCNDKCGLFLTLILTDTARRVHSNSALISAGLLIFSATVVLMMSSSTAACIESNKEQLFTDSNSPLPFIHFSPPLTRNQPCKIGDWKSMEQSSSNRENLSPQQK